MNEWSNSNKTTLSFPTRDSRVESPSNNSNGQWGMYVYTHGVNYAAQLHIYDTSFMIPCLPYFFKVIILLTRLRNFCIYAVFKISHARFSLLQHVDNFVFMLLWSFHDIMIYNTKRCFSATVKGCCLGIFQYANRISILFLTLFPETYNINGLYLTCNKKWDNDALYSNVSNFHIICHSDSFKSASLFRIMSLVDVSFNLNHVHWS